MMFNYQKMQNLAGKLIPNFAQGAVKVIKRTANSGPAYNPGAPIETETALNATVTGVSKIYVDNGLAIGSDLELTIPGNSAVVPVMGDAIRIDGAVYQIVSILSIPPSGTVIVYKVLVRK